MTTRLLVSNWKKVGNSRPKGFSDHKEVLFLGPMATGLGQ